jgi:hypothetical protein
MYTQFTTCASGVDPDQLAHPCHLIRICTVRVLIHKVISDKEANSAALDQMAQG